MFWMKKKVRPSSGTTGTDEVASEAEKLYRSGKMHCAEAVLAAVAGRYCNPPPEGIQALAAGFGGGSGSGCICGAVVGGTMALGLVLQDRRKTSSLTKTLHSWFKEEYKSTCCRVIKAKERDFCPILTGRVAGKVALLLEEAK